MQTFKPRLMKSSAQLIDLLSGMKIMHLTIDALWMNIRYQTIPLIFDLEIEILRVYWAVDFSSIGRCFQLLATLF